MGEVLSFKSKKSDSLSDKGKKQKQTKKVAAKKPNQTNEKKTATSKINVKSKPKKSPTMNAESIKLWWISQEFDELIRRAVIEKHIPVEELSAVMAHRLGSLLVVSERTPELTLFCMKLISKITNQKETGSNAS